MGFRITIVGVETIFTVVCVVVVLANAVVLGVVLVTVVD